MKRFIQIALQAAFVILFVLLIMKGKVQLWMVLFLSGVLASLVFGRFYCGWICPINTVMSCVAGFKRKLQLPSMAIPNFLKKTWVRYLILVLFFAVFLFSINTGKKLPVLPIVFALGVVITLIFPEELWHRYLCPYGTILHASSLPSKFGMKIDDLCVNCGLCSKVCPAAAVEKGSNQYIIHKSDCLVCMKCQSVCKPQAIRYR